MSTAVANAPVASVSSPATSINAILEQLAAGKISPVVAGQLIASLTPPALPRKSRITASLNKSGGVYFTHPAFTCYSKAKSKNYQGSVNLDIAVAKALFGPDGDKVYAALRTEIAPLLESAK